MNDSEEVASARAAKSLIKNLGARLTPRMLLILLIMALLLLTGIIALAVVSGKTVSVWKLKIETPKEPTDIVDLKQNDEIAKTLRLADLPGVLRPGMSKEEMVSHIQELAKRAAELDMLETRPDFVFFKLERMINEHDGSINTHIKQESRKGVYRLIQLSLQAINSFKGEADGIQESTNSALVEFQQNYNSKVPEEQQVKHIGFFGHLTLAAVRAQFRAITEE